MGEEHNVFISWAGHRSKWVAEEMRDWLPLVIQAAKPWMSSTDIDKGGRGLMEVSNKLVGMKVGIVCLTPESQDAPWILYEAGALSKTIDDKTRLCTYLLGGLRFQDVNPPLSMFQATSAEKKDTRELIGAVNKALSNDPVSETRLDILFEHLWPRLEAKIATMPAPQEPLAPKRSVEDIVTEILEIARAESNNRKLLEDKVLFVQKSLESRLPLKPLSAHDLMFADRWGEVWTVDPAASRIVQLSDLMKGPAKPEADTPKKPKKK